MGYHDTSFDASVARRRPRSPEGVEPVRSRRRAYGYAAFATAIDDGLMPDEVRQILAGRRIIDAFPVRWGESVPAYAERTVAEMMVAYLRDDPSDRDGSGRSTSRRPSIGAPAGG